MEIHDFTISSYEGLRALFTIVGNLFRTILFVLRKVVCFYNSCHTLYKCKFYSPPLFIYTILLKKNKVKWKLRLNDHGLSVYNYTQCQSEQNHQNIHVYTQNIVHKIKYNVVIHYFH